MHSGKESLRHALKELERNPLAPGMSPRTWWDSYNRLEFTHCHAYSTQSDIRFDPEPHGVRNSTRRMY